MGIFWKKHGDVSIAEELRISLREHREVKHWEHVSMTFRKGTTPLEKQKILNQSNPQNSP